MSGLYKINPDGLGEFEVFCDQKTAGGGWTVFQRRQDGSVNFYRGWNHYKLGFGNLNGEFWLGLDKIHRLTASKNKKLRVDLEATAGTILLAEYRSFAVANEKAKYRLTVGGYSGENSPQMTANGLRLTTVLFPLDYADIYGESCFFFHGKKQFTFFFLQAMLEILLLNRMECSLAPRTVIMTSGPRTAHRLSRERGGTQNATVRT